MMCYSKYRPASPSLIQIVTSPLRRDYNTGLQRYEFSKPLVSFKKTGLFGWYLGKSATKFGIGTFTNPLTNLTTISTIDFPVNTTGTGF